jgi:hypothetical protein
MPDETKNPATAKKPKPPDVMLILRGNRGRQYDEQGKKRFYDMGALHEKAALEYARRMGYKGIVLNVSGSPDKNGRREHCLQTERAITRIHKDTSIKALYGFSGGGYNVRHILGRLGPEDRNRLERVVVLGVEENVTPQAQFEAETFKDKNANWTLVYRNDPKPEAPAVLPSAKDDPHMFGPEQLLWETPDPDTAKRPPARYL